ncbi:dTDP-L-rhamnose 4-epimerase [Knoellia remsis]|uniref:dTDP-L-rhamnose 4-epimerase n=1 Tax=Knoellia remsis TaxID=407159 RepID=A0A2T0UZF3_9MICO|nr:NAD(P)-dependent oxidoreductase [Knoellia remsis]PRY63218.1 dTDP-L-rhamnose 4-epimerase [Knoellia remsis]
MTVLITGGAGFIGQHLARRLRTAGHDVLALDSLLGQVHLDPDASVAAFPGEVVVGDVAEAATWENLDQRDDIDTLTAVVHLAAETGTGQSMYEPERHRRVNVGGTKLAVAFAQRHAIPLVALSSRAVYGEGRHGCPVHGTTFGSPCCERAVPEASQESDEHRPVSVYGETKSEGETVIARRADGIPATILRPQNVIGAGQALHNPYTGVLAAFLAMLKEGRPLTVYGDGSQTRDVVHVSDLVETIAWSLDNPPTPGETRILNSGSGIRTTLLELAECAAAGAPVVSPGITHLDVHRAGDIDHACADLTLTRELGAPLPRWSPADAVAEFITRSWTETGAPADAWDDALDELSQRGLTS